MKSQQHAEQFIKDHTKQRGRVGIINPSLHQAINPQTRTLLDAGCGDGSYHSEIVEKFPFISQIIGIDCSKEILSKAKENGKTIFKHLNSTQKIQQFQGRFDTIIAIYMIQHLSIQQLYKFLDNCVSWLKQNGQLIISSFNPNTLVKSKAYMKTIQYEVIGNTPFKDGQIFKIKLGDWINEDHHYGPEFLYNQLVKRGFSAKAIYVDKGQIDNRFFTQEQIKQIQESHSMYNLKAKKTHAELKN